MTPGLSNAEWADALTRHFFRPEYANRYVLFYIDRPLLAELGRMSEDAAVRSLVASQLPHLRPRQPTTLFEPLIKETVKWKIKGGDGSPPCVPALALAVLAASEMRHEGDRASTNYHAWFHELMQLSLPDIDDEDVWHSYADAYPILWQNLQWWLSDLHEGSLGISTITEDSRNTKYGFADSQTIFKSSDREKLTQFFRWIRLRPGLAMPTGELLQYFKIWAARRDDLSPGAAQMVREDRLEQLQLGRLIEDAASRWDGGLRDDQGRLEGRLALTLSRPPASIMGLAAPCPPGFPERLVVQHDGREILLEAEDADLATANDERRWYEGDAFELGERNLSQGLRIESGGYVLRLPPYSVHILHMSPELGCWSSVDQIRPSEPAWLLVSERELEQVSAHLARVARPGWEPITREGIAPGGWILIRNVIIDSVAVADPDSLSRLTPRLSNRLTLNGGLPLPRGAGVYLTRGEPDVMLPPAPEDSPALPLDLDGARVSVDDGASSVSLANLSPAEGSHLVQIGSIKKRFSTLRTLQQVSPHVESPIGHQIKMSAECLEPVSLDAASNPGLQASGARVLGAQVEVGDSLATIELIPPLVLPRTAQRIVLLSESPGVLEEVEVPAEPPWMRRAGLECQSFEYFPKIDARWLLTEWRATEWRPLSLRLRRLDPSSGPESKTAEDPIPWAELILSCDPSAAEEPDRDAWEALQAMARGEL